MDVYVRAGYRRSDGSVMLCSVKSGGLEILSNVEKKWWMCKLEQCIEEVMELVIEV